MKQTIRLDEAQFNKLVKETVKRVLKESEYDTLEDSIVKFKQAADEVLSFDNEDSISDDYTPGEFDTYFISLYRLAKEVSDTTDSILGNVYQHHPRVYY